MRFQNVFVPMNSAEQSNGVMGTGCAQIATIIILHLDPSAIG